MYPDAIDDVAKRFARYSAGDIAYMEPPSLDKRREPDRSICTFKVTYINGHAFKAKRQREKVTISVSNLHMHF